MSVRDLQPIIGRYPPRLRDEAHRQDVYEAWIDVVASAEGLGSEAPEEARLYLLAELYRQGHNLDVRGAAELADSNLGRCLDLFPRSRPCNLSASFFYLSIIPTAETLSKAERSLMALRREASPGFDEEAEAGFIFLYLQSRDVDRTRGQIERYLRLFPSSGRADDFRVMRDHLGPTIELRAW